MSAPGQANEGRPRFPALDPEPEPRPWWWRVLVGAGMVAAAGTVVAAVTFWPSSSGASGPRRTAAQSVLPAAADRGRIVALESSGNLVLTDPGGTHVTKLSAIGKVGQETVASEDGRYLSLGNGQVLIVKKDATLAGYPARVPISSIATPAWPDSFADHDRDLIILPGGYGGQGSSAQNPVTVVSIASGTSRSLGEADAVAADPQVAGAFVSVAAPQIASSTTQQSSPDSRVELRDAGLPAVVLATAGALRRDLSLGQNDPVALDPFPNPSGDKIAVEVLPVDGTTSGIVMLNRTGRVIGTLLTPFGVQGTPVWSPSGTSLAYPSIGNDGPGLFIWTGGGQAAARPFPLSAANDAAFSRCVWSPDGKSILCEREGPGQHHWVVVGASGGALAEPAQAPGLPLAWLPGGGGR